MKMMSQILHGYCLIRSLLTCSYVTCMHRHLIHNQTVSFCIAPYSLHDLYPIEYLIKVPIQENPESRRAPIRQDNIKPLQKDDAKKKRQIGYQHIIMIKQTRHQQHTATSRGVSW